MNRVRFGWWRVAAVVALLAALAPLHGGLTARVASAASRLVVESPASDSEVMGVVSIAGWAADPGAASGTGIDEVSVWTAEGPAKGKRLAVGVYGLPRPDVGAALGGPRFGSVGYAIDLDTFSLGKSGGHALVVAARSGKEWTTVPLSLTVVAPWEGAGNTTVVGESFRVYETPAARIHYREGVSAERLAAVTSGFAFAAAVGPEVTGLPPLAEPVPVYVFASANDFLALTSKIQGIKPSEIGRYYTSISVSAPAPYPGVFMSVANDNLDAHTHTAVQHYLMVLMDGPLQGQRLGQWFHQGLADYIAGDLLRASRPSYEARHAYSTLAYLASSYAGDQLYPLAQLEEEGFWTDLGNRDPEAVGAAQAEATQAAYKLVKRTGIQRVLDVLTGVTPGRGWREAFQITFGQTLAEFEADYFGSLPELFPAVLPEQGPAGGSFYFVALGFKPNERVAMKMTGPNNTRVNAGDKPADAAGVFDVGFRTKADWPAGKWTLDLAGDAGTKLTLAFTVQ